MGARAYVCYILMVKSTQDINNRNSGQTKTNRVDTIPQQHSHTMYDLDLL